MLNVYFLNELSLSSALSTLGIFLVSCLSFYLLNFYINLSRYPRGPIPLPILGNILVFRQKKHVHDILCEMANAYGGLTTLWCSTIPIIIISDPKLTVHILKERKNDFAGRPYFPIEKMSFKTPDIVLGDFGDHQWEVSRRAGHLAVRKYAVSESLPHRVVEVVDDFVDDIKKANQQPLAMGSMLHSLTFRMLARMAFGVDFKRDDPTFLGILDMINIFMNNNGFIFLTSILPLVEYTFFYKTYVQFEKAKIFQRRTFFKFVDDHEKQWKARDDNDNQLNDFGDAIFSAKRDAAQQGQQDVVDIMSRNVICSIMYDLFVAGGDTTKDTLLWLMLIISNYPQVQEKMRAEIEDLDENEVPNLQLRDKCHYIQAVISETMRFRPIVPLGIPHKATSDVELAGYTIKKGTMVMASLHNVMNDDTCFDEPHLFKPERFINSSGEYNARVPSFYPFSVGRRNCIGEKLALANLFIIVVRILQRTKGYTFVPENGPGTADLSGDISNTAFFVPNAYKIKLVKNSTSS